MRDFVLRLAKSLGIGPAVTARSVARERLSIILAHQRVSDVNIQQLQADVLACVQKYIPVAPEQAVSVKVKQDNGMDVFEMQILLNGAAGPAATAAAAAKA